MVTTNAQTTAGYEEIKDSFFCVCGKYVQCIQSDHDLLMDTIPSYSQGTRSHYLPNIGSIRIKIWTPNRAWQDPYIESTKFYLPSIPDMITCNLFNLICYFLSLC